MTKPIVYFTQEISPDSLIRIYQALGRELTGNIGVKISTGEPGGHNYLKPDLIAKLVQKLNASIIECNTAYAGRRNTLSEHLRAVEEHGFTKIAPVDIMDAEGEFEIPVSNGRHLQYDIVGNHLKNYDSILNLAHFKGHAMGGFGGVIKNQSIGVASSAGKAYIHTAGATRNVNELWGKIAEQNAFLESMAEAAKAVADYMHGNILYINVMNNLSVDCDCDSHPENPCMADIGILGSVDPVAVDQAAIDKIWSSTDRGRDHFIARVERQNGRHILPYAESLQLGSREYELVDLD
ncbi:MAG: DUF362 domain-containing protein [Alphaproteobacteria bacterium]|nr:DUF362 domain-containing protein [Alphaproteobacteria bacterium]